MASYLESDLLDALSAVQRGEIHSTRAAAKHYSVPKSTLQARLAGRPTLNERHPRNARLSDDQERSLALYIRDLQRQYAPLDRLNIANIAWRMAGSDPAKPIGVN